MSNLQTDPNRRQVSPSSLALLQLMHESFPDPLSRCSAVAAEVFSRWQLGGHTLSQSPPSMLLVNCGSLEHDPIWELIGRNCWTDNPPPTGEAAVKVIQEWVDKRISFPTQSMCFEDSIEALLQGLRDGTFSSDQRDEHVAMWEPPLGLTAPQTAKQKGSRMDSRPDPELPTSLEILDDRPHPVAKLPAICGSIGSDSWGWELVSDILNHELPILFLPHAASGSSPLQSKLGQQLATDNFMSPCEQQTRHTVPMAGLPPWEDSPWLKHLESVMLSQLRFLPSGYQFFLLRTIRNLASVCSSIVAQIHEDDLPADVATLVASDLLQMTTWAMVTGVENLTWHGWGPADYTHIGLGVKRGGPSRELSKLLKAVHDGGAISAKALERKTSKLGGRDLQRASIILLNQGYVKEGPRKLPANPLADYVKDAPWRSSLPTLNLLTTPYYSQMKERGNPV